MNRRDYRKLVDAGVGDRILTHLIALAAEMKIEAPKSFWVESIAWENVADDESDKPEMVVMINVSFKNDGVKKHIAFQVIDGQPFGTANDEPLTGEQFAVVMRFVAEEHTVPAVSLTVSPEARKSPFSSPFGAPKPAATPVVEEVVPSLFKRYPIDGKDGLTINVTKVNTATNEVAGPLIWKLPKTVVALVIPYEGLGGNTTYTDWAPDKRDYGYVFPRGELTITVAGTRYKIVEIETITIQLD
jgi:hypothetical protein